MGRPCSDCGSDDRMACHDEAWVCTKTYEVIRKSELDALRGEVARLREAVEWACSDDAGSVYDYQRIDFIKELRRRAGRE